MFCPRQGVLYAILGKKWLCNLFLRTSCNGAPTLSMGEPTTSFGPTHSLNGFTSALHSLPNGAAGPGDPIFYPQFSCRSEISPFFLRWTTVFHKTFHYLPQTRFLKFCSQSLSGGTKQKKKNTSAFPGQERNLEMGLFPPPL